MLSQKYQSKNEEIYWELKSMVAVLPKRQFNFLACWHEICGQENKEFGFPGECGFKGQTKAAFKFLKKIDNHWVHMMQDNLAEGSFSEFFYKEGKKEGLLLPDNFVQLIDEKLIAMEDL